MENKVIRIKELLAQGKTTREIASELRVSLRDIHKVRQQEGLDMGALERQIDARESELSVLKNEGLQRKQDIAQLDGQIMALREEKKELEIEIQRKKEMDLQRTVLSVLGNRKNMIEKSKQVNADALAQSQEMAIRDGVTGFYNHRLFQERAREEMEQAKRLDMPISLLMINIDLFRIYNEIHGHAEGDRALAEMAKVIRGVARKTDLMFRYSGDEFAMLAPGMKHIEAYAFAERMRKAVESHPFPGLVSGKGVLTISIGIACYPEHVADAETLAFCAELALLESKKKGRNTVTTYAPIQAAEAPSSKTPDKRAALSKASQLSHISTILALAAALDAKDPFTYGHSQKVAKYAVLLGEAIGIEPERLSALRTAALLHDIGKIGIPDGLLLKPQRFNDEERIEVQKHATLAVSILKHIPSLSNLLPHIVHHHERFDGTGYPDGIRGEDIPLEARVLSIADSYDAMTSPRQYKPTLTTKEAIAEIKKCAGTQFDPKLANVFCEIIWPAPPKVSHFLC